MFATWKYDRDTSEVQNIRLAYDPISARSSQHQACDRCHEKKLKCSGEKDGCDRCISTAHPCVYNRSEARCSRRGKRGSRCSTDSSTISETLSRPASNSGSPSRRTTPQQQQQPNHRIRKGASQTRRKSNSSLTAQSRSSTEPDADFISPYTSATPSVTGSPYSLSNFATVSEGISYGVSGPYEHINTANMATNPHQHHHQHHHQQPQQQQHAPYSMPYHDCSYQSNSAWPSQYPRDSTTSAGMSSSFLATVSNPHAFPVLTPPDDYMQFEVYSGVQAGGSDFWQYRR